MHVKTFSLKKGFRAVLVAASLSVGLAGCGGGSSSAPPAPAPPPPPNLSQTAALVNDVDINYTATLANVNQATRTVTHNGNSFGNPVTISTPAYSETLNGLEKGDYSSRLEATGATTHTVNWNIPNYAPTADQAKIDALETNLDEIWEGSQLTLNLEGTFSDKNPEDRPVPINSVTSSDGKTQVSFSGYDVTVQAVGSPGTYEFNVEYGSNSGGLENVVINGEILAVPEQIALYRLIEESPGVFAQDIYVMEIDEQGNRVGEVKNLTNSHGQSQNLHPYFSPDGMQLAFTSNRDSKLRIYLMNTNGSGQEVISPADLEFAIHPSWCNNGEIFFNYRDSNTNTQGIASINPDGTGFEKIIEEPFIGRLSARPACSPDGSQIVYVSFQDGNPELYVANFDGSNPRRLTNNLAENFQPAWVLNKIFFTSSRDNPGQVGEFNIYSINPDGTGLERLTSVSGVEIDAAFSLNGEKVIFTHDIPSFFNPNIYFSELTSLSDSSKWKQLTTEGIVNRYPAWRPRP